MKKSKITINDAYLFFVKKIIEDGVYTYKDENDWIIDTLGNFAYINDPLNLKYSAKYQNYTSEMLLNDIQNETFDIQGNPIKSKALYEYVKSFDDSSKHGFVYTYPNRILDHFHVNQFNIMKDRLIKHINSNRAVAVTYDPILDGVNKDIPCLQVLQIVIRDNKLTLHCFFRSNDMYFAFYSNMYFLTYIALKMTEELNREIVNADIIFAGIYYHSSSSHIYAGDVKGAKKMIKEVNNAK